MVVTAARSSAERATLHSAYSIAQFAAMLAHSFHLPSTQTRAQMWHVCLQVARIAAALALAPMLDSACDFAQQKLGLSSKRTALSLVVFSCIALASLCFGATMLVWA